MEQPTFKKIKISEEISWQYIENLPN